MVEGTGTSKPDKPCTAVFHVQPVYITCRSRLITSCSTQQVENDKNRKKWKCNDVFDNTD